jgi:hypothetical protein
VVLPGFIALAGQWEKEGNPSLSGWCSFLIAAFISALGFGNAQ